MRFLLVFGLLSGAMALPAEATTTAPSPSQISSARSQAAALEATIASQSEKEQIAAERYDQANAKVEADTAELTRLRRELAKEQLAVARERALVRQTAVAAYVFGEGQTAQFASVLTGTLANAGSLTTYAGVATNTLHSAVIRLQVDESSIVTNTQLESKAEAADLDAAKSAASDRNDAAAAAAATQSSLNAVKGHLAQLIAEQEAAIAAAAEARARAATQARERAAAAATAAEAAAVASAVAGGDPAATLAATAAANSANAASSSGASTLVQSGSNPSGNEAVATAQSYLGIPYVWGGANRHGVDCSGLTMLSWAAAGVPLTHSAWYQFNESAPVATNALQPGDLLFYDLPNDGSDPITHVAMYVGSGPYGTQTIIQAPQTGQLVSYAPMYFYGFVGAGRPH